MHLTKPPFLLLLLAALTLSGCSTLAPQQQASPAPPTEVDPWALRQASLAASTGFSLSGRAAVQSGDAGWSASLDWVQSGADFQMQLTGPFNQGTVRLEGGTEGVVLSSDGRSLSAPDVDALLGEELGWKVPVAALRYWVLGLPAPEWSTEQLRLDDAGRLTDVRQGPWRLSVLRYADDGPLALPAKVFVMSDQASLRLVIQSFTLKR
jgi:outer membrane lipoprotein LolB